ncbi:hypothetical protein LINGRAHAP2_LOCUS14504 [Linum grandiflorum]
MEENDDDLMPYHIHDFWRSLEYHKPPEVDKWEAHDAADRSVLQGMVQKVCHKGGPSVWALSRLIWSEFQPESEGLKEPKESDAPKGRPRKKATARDPSWFEHEGVRTTPSKSRSTPGKSRLTPNKERPTPTSKSRPTPNEDLVDVEWLLPILEPSLSWTTWVSWETTTAWVNLYAVERNLYHNLGP